MGETILDEIDRILAEHVVFAVDPEPDGFGGVTIRIQIANSRRLAGKIVKAVEEDIVSISPSHKWPQPD